MSDSSDGSVLEIRDPAIDAEAVLQRVADGVEQRRAADAYGPDPVLVGPKALRPTDSSDSEPSLAHFDFQALNQALAEMTGHTQLQGLTFSSQVPILGCVVAAVRNAWSWMAARWLDQHVRSQQTAFNQAALQFSGELMRWQDANLWRVRELEEQVRNLEARLARLEDNSATEKEDAL